MHHAAGQAAHRFPSLGLKPVFLGGNCRVRLLRDEECMVWFPAAAGLPPCGPLRTGLCMARTPGFDKNAVAPASEQLAQKQLSFVALFRTNQFAEAQGLSAGYTPIQRPPEGGIHLDNHSLRRTSGYGNGSVLEDGAESRLCILTCGKFRLRKWNCGIHSPTVARDGSRKKARDGLSDTLVFPVWER